MSINLKCILKILLLPFMFLLEAGLLFLGFIFRLINPDITDFIKQDIITKLPDGEWYIKNWM